MNAAPIVTDPPRIVRLPDGRRLACAEFGDPAGSPVLQFHGVPSSRLEARFGDEAARDCGVRLIGVDRPGIGGSDPLPGRRIADWPRDVAALADALGLARFAVVGVSGGAPYALACAHALPGRLTAVGLVCGAAPPQAAADGASWRPALRVIGALARRAPWSLRPGLALLGMGLRRAPRVVRALERRFVLHPSDAPVLTTERAHGWFRAMTLEALRQGSAGAAWDTHLLYGPWDVPLREVQAPVLLWHGEADTVVPAAMGRWLALTLPRCRAEFLPGLGHFALPLLHAGRILAALKAQAGAARAADQRG